jgi:UDP-N-acetylglucosamine 2-epimerase (non-hydrolysing)
VLVVAGTRPEAIKLCPLVLALHGAGIETQLCATGQHGSIADDVFAAFGVQPDHRLNLQEPNQSLASLTARAVEALGELFETVSPTLVVVQGDTTSALCAALSAFYACIPVAHVEAGLRTFDSGAPFPEEINRVLITRLASLHFAPLLGAAGILRAEGVHAGNIEVTGNTGIDALFAICERLDQGLVHVSPLTLDPCRKLILVTAHRRENFGHRLKNICDAVDEIRQRSDVVVVWPIHPNPNVRTVVESCLAHSDSLHLVAPLRYVEFVDLMRRSYLLLTDSGGLQEEGAALGRPVLVMREVTERREGTASGNSRLVGTSRSNIVQETRRLLDDDAAYRAMARPCHLYGDGKASARIVDRIRAFLGPT